MTAHSIRSIREGLLKKEFRAVEIAREALAHAERENPKTNAYLLFSSERALEAAERNFALNRDVPAVAACPRETAQADVFCWLREPAARRFDLIVLDPPALAKRASEREEAMRAYSRLLTGAMARLNGNGMLVAASCSAHVSAGDFFDLAREAARATGRGFEEWLATRHAPDHPVTFPEGGYLKCIYLRFR